MAPEPLRQAPHASPQFFFVEPIDVAQDFGGELAARYALGGDLVKQPVLRLGGQIAQQPLGDPGGPLRVVKAGFLQGGGPVVAQIDRHGAPVGRGCRTQAGQRRGLEVDHLRLIDFEDDGAGWPAQPVGAGIQAGSQDDGLPNPGSGGIQKEVVEVVSANGHRVGEPPQAVGLVFG
ncbi:Uncharacterised protein [Mycobacterium tuberculosis]|uniref:Uncharacterized protein n=1 Tax=Mycobacterium tuberculosis TaxID=1773 RepID=A0A655FYH6_MYCTX|nr:Uncharacterised protein [Mycobacterium tuberculosis]CKU84987.1 Uncharacterised protein [Mycobacterium tuberculosis]CNN35222.1 Uncharacterised protein [Mycobacterium tuberculosis]CNW01797.1 Uncharacterised protein [Mycobacterium tuberculosis]CNW42923.1 Uncharacterised protein [Mycobacterium tuberculosis]